LEIDSRIIPLFRSHIQVKKKHLLKKNNYDLNLIIPKKLKLINEVIPLNVKLVKIYNLINNYSLIINNLYLKNDILKALPSEDKLKVKMSLDSIALKLKLFEPIFRFKSLNFENYLKKKKFKSLFQSETHFLLRSLFFKKNVKVNEENLNNKKKVENNKKSSNIVSPTYNSKLLGLKPNFIKPTTKNKIKKTEGTETISAALKEIKGEGYKGKERDIKKKNNTSLINKVEKDNFVDFVKNSSDTLKKIKKIKKEISIQKQKKKNLFSLYFNNSIYPYKSNISNIQPDMLGEREKGLIKGVKKIKTYKNLKSLIKLNYLDLAIKLGLESGNTKIIYTNLFADRFLKKRLGPKPRKNKDLALDSKLYTHKIRTPIDRNKFLYHRKLENKIANKNPRIRYWYNHTVKPFTTPSQTLVEGKRERGENLILNKYINLRNTFTKTSYKTISKPLNIKIKNTLLNSLMIHNNLKNKNILNKFYKFKILNNHKKYFL
jgi:hypothetical protein